MTSRILSSVLLLYAAAFCLVSGYYMLAAFVDVPYWDHWDWFRVFVEPHDFWDFHWVQRNEHRIVPSSLVFELDADYFGASNRLVMAVMLSCMAGLVAAMAYPVGQDRTLAASTRKVALALCGIALFWLLQWENLLWPFSLHIVMSKLLAVAAFLFFSHWLAAFQAAERRNARWSFALSLVLAFAATFTFGDGLLVWPALVVVMLSARVFTRHLVAVSLSFAATLSLFLWKYAFLSPWGETSLVARIPAMAKFFFLYFGSPALQEGMTRAVVQDAARLVAPLALGLAGVAAGAWVVLGLLRGQRRPRTWSAWFYGSIVVWVLGCAALSAVTRRAWQPEAAMASRYSTTVILYWLSLLMLAAPRWDRLFREGAATAAKCLGQATVVLAVALLTWSQLAYARWWGLWMSQVEQATLSLLTGVPDRHQLACVFPADRSEVPLKVAKVLKEREMSIFRRPEHQLLGSRLVDTYAIQDPSDCIGGFDALRSLNAQGAKAAGWAWDRAAGKVPPLILLVDASGIIRGLARCDCTHPSAAAPTKPHAMKRAGWGGYARIDRGLRPMLAAFAVRADGQTVERLPGAPALEPAKPTP